MFFGEVKTEDSENSILATSMILDENNLKIKIKKGTIINKKIITLLLKNKIKYITCAKLEEADIDENIAVHKISQKIICKKNANLKLSESHQGRCNILSKINGLLKFDTQKLLSINSITDEVGLATLKPYSLVKKNQIIASTKAIPFAINKKLLKKIEKASVECLQVLPFQKMNVHLIQTKNNHTPAKILNKTILVTEKRLLGLGLDNFIDKTCDHNIKSLSDNINSSINEGADIILVFGISAICDVNDIIPLSLRENKGTVIRLGMPVEPGNLMLLGELKKSNKIIPFIGMPGCARSQKENGVDWILWRLFCGLSVSNEDINNMGNGGLL
jgi:molybdenum cofactor cytidylyltransferase